MTRSVTVALGLVVLIVPPLSAQRLPLTLLEEVGLSSERLQRIGEISEDCLSTRSIAGGSPALGLPRIDRVISCSAQPAEYG